jgi:hypothetical protein
MAHTSTNPFCGPLGQLPKRFAGSKVEGVFTFMRLRSFAILESFEVVFTETSLGLPLGLTVILS